MNSIRRFLSRISMCNKYITQRESVQVSKQANWSHELRRFLCVYLQARVAQVKNILCTNDNQVETLQKLGDGICTDHLIINYYKPYY